MMAVLYKHGIPLLIFSAGVGNVIEELLKHRYRLYSNTHIIANWMKFNLKVTYFYYITVFVRFITYNPLSNIRE